MARQAQADLELNRGIAALYSNREEAMLALSDARKAYTEVIAGATSNPESCSMRYLDLRRLRKLRETSMVPAIITSKSSRDIRIP